MNTKSMNQNHTLISLGRARLAVVRLLLLGLLPAGLLISSPLAAAPSTSPPSGTVDLVADAAATHGAVVEEASAQSLVSLLGGLADFLFDLGSVVVFLELWWVWRGVRRNLFAALGGVFVLVVAVAGRVVMATVGRLGLGFLFTSFLMLSVARAPAGTAAAAGPVPPQGIPGLGIILLAQAAADPPFDPIISFLSKVMLLVGGVMVFAGGWKIHKGENTEGLLAIAGGFIVAMAFPIIRYFASLM